MNTTISYTIAELAQRVGGDVYGNPQEKITGIAAIDKAQPQQLCFLDNKRYTKYLAITQASGVILSEQYLSDCHTNAIVTPEPYLAYAKIATVFAQKNKPIPGIHPTAIIGINCQFADTVSIGPYCVIGNDVVIGEDTFIDPHCILGDRVSIGSECQLFANVTLYHDTILKNRVMIHSGTVIGSDGFGYAKGSEGYEKVPQLGGVIIEDDVEIGAGTTIDRGAIDNTIIGKGCKLDNQIQIAHNVEIGAYTIIAGCVGIAGSVKIGSHCMIGGGAGIVGHVEICDHVWITAATGISKSIKKPGIYASGIQAEEHHIWRKNASAFRHLGKMQQQIKQFEKLIEE